MIHTYIILKLMKVSVYAVTSEEKILFRLFFTNYLELCTLTYKRDYDNDVHQLYFMQHTVTGIFTFDTLPLTLW